MESTKKIKKGQIEDFISDSTQTALDLKLSNNPTDYTDATTPLAGTEVALVEQGGTFKKVAVSEFGGGGSTLDITSTFPNRLEYKTIFGSIQNIGGYSNLSIVGTQSQVISGSTVLRKILSSSTPGDIASVRQSAIPFILQTTPFWFDQRIDELDSGVASDSRCSYGLATTALMGNIEPSAYVTALLSLGHESTDSNFQIFYKNSTFGGALNKIDLGVNFPKNLNKSFHLRFYRLPNETTINYYVKNITDGFEASGSFEFVGAPPFGLTPNNWRNNNTSAIQVGFGINRIITRIADV